MKIIACLFFVLSVGACLMAQAGDTPADRENKPQLQKLSAIPGERTTVIWQPDTLFFGEVYEGAILLDSFQVTNTGTNPYMIKSVKTSCDCTVLRFPTYSIMPGETAAIRVEFDSAGKAGHAQPGIVVYDNSQPNSRNILYIDGNVMPRKKPRNSLEGN
ncbi:MAG: DUF1573 domain-containing protein [Lewinellaceae bacterium]|nr:DUF1573 domain-containing protein [Lewinellaceae bacterium]